MSEAKIDEAGLRALCEAATPGPWEATGLAEYEHVNYEPRPDNIVDSASGIVAETGESNREEEDAAFIAAARTAVPALLDLVASLRAVIAEHLPHENGPGKTTPGDADAWTAAMWNIGNQHERAEKAEKERDEALAKLSAVHDRVASVLHMAGLPYAARYELEQAADGKEQS